jgi:uncharacterized delta-60 repeat protein
MSATQLIEPLEPRRLFSAGALDTSFNGTGELSYQIFADTSRVLIQPDQKILVASEPDVLLQGKGVLSRFLPNGQFDPTFKDPNGSNTGYQVTSLTTDIGLTSNSEIVGLGGNSLMKLYPNGLHDPSFGAHGTAIPGSGLRMALTHQDQIVVAYFGTGGQNLFVRRYDTYGTWDTGFGNNGDTAITSAFSNFEFRDIGVTFDGHVLLFGNYNLSNGGSEFAVIRLNPNGQIDNSFGSHGLVVVNLGSLSDQRVWAGEVTPDNKLLIGGEMNSQMVVARLTSSGALDTTFAGTGIKSIADGAFSIVRSITTGPDGRIFLAGRTNGPTNQNGNFEVVRLTSGGALDSSFGQGGIATADLGTAFDGGTSVAVGSNGRVVVGGDVYNPVNFTQALRMGMAVFTGNTIPDNDNEISDARSVSLNSTTNATIGSSGDVDMYKITVVADQRVSFQVQQSAGDQFDPYLRIFNSQRQTIVVNDGGFLPDSVHRLGSPPPVDPYLDYTFSNAGTYYIGISSSPNQSYDAIDGASGDTRGFAGPYSLTLKNLSNTPQSHNKLSNALSVPADRVVATSFTDSKDVLLIKFTLSQPVTFTIDLDTVAGNFNSYLRLFNSSGAQLAANDNGAGPGETLGTDSYLSFTASAVGTYYLGVSSNANINYNPVTGAGAVAGGIGAFNLLFNFGPLVFHR